MILRAGPEAFLCPEPVPENAPETKLAGIKTRSGQVVWPEFNAACVEWTVYARYSPKNAKLDQADSFLETVAEVKKWLKAL